LVVKLGMSQATTKTLSVEIEVAQACSPLSGPVVEETRSGMTGWP
jgi:hypothetical protein